MANIGVIFFTTQFILFFLIFSIKFYNILSLGKVYKDEKGKPDLKMPFLLWIGSFIVTSIGFLMFLANYETAEIRFLYMLQGGLMMFNTFFFLGEAFFYTQGKLETIEKELGHYNIEG